MSATTTNPLPETSPHPEQEAKPPRPPRGAPTHFLVLAGYLLLTLVLTYPIALDLFTKVPGGGDAWQHVWNLWWVKRAVLNLQNPYHTSLIYYPDGVNLYFHTLVLTAGLMGIPLQLAGLGLIPTYNLLILLGFLLGAYGAYLLCHYLTGHVWASFVGGFIFAFAPYHFAHLLGHLNLASLQWIPFYVLLLLKALDPPSTSAHTTLRTQRSALVYAASAGVLLAVNAYTDWLYGIFLVLFTGILVGWRLLVSSERRAIGEGPGWVPWFSRLAVVGGLALLLVSPILFPTLEEARQGYAQQPPAEVLVYSSDALLAFLPSERHPIWGFYISHQLTTRNPSERDVFLGYTVLALAAYGTWRLRRNRQVIFWAFVAVATWVLSLGPILQVAGKSSFTAFNVSIPLPYLLLYKLPLFNIMRTPARLTVLTMLALGVLVAFTLAAVLGSRRFPVTLPRPGTRLSWSRALFAAVLPALIAFEFLATPYPTVPPGWNVPIYSKIAAEPGQFALLELPIRPMGDYMAYQTVHGKPIIGGYLSRQPPYPLLTEVPALKYVLDGTEANDPIKAQMTGGKGVKALSDLGVKYIIVRWWTYFPKDRPAMQSKLDALLARPPDFSYPNDQVDVWQIRP